MESEDRRSGAYKLGGLAPLVFRFQLVQTSTTWILFWPLLPQNTYVCHEIKCILTPFLNRFFLLKQNLKQI